jgi:hypothetical protein
MGAKSIVASFRMRPALLSRIWIDSTLDTVRPSAHTYAVRARIEPCDSNRISMISKALFGFQKSNINQQMAS